MKFRKHVIKNNLAKISNREEMFIKERKCVGKTILNNYDQ